MAKTTSNDAAGARTSGSDAKRLNAIQKIRELMVEHNLTLGEIRPPLSRTKKLKFNVSDVKAKVIYRHPTSGEQWDGRGAVPAWLAEFEKGGQPRGMFMVKTGWGRTPFPKYEPKDDKKSAKKVAAKKPAAKKALKKAAKKR